MNRYTGFQLLIIKHDLHLGYGQNFECARICRSIRVKYDRVCISSCRARTGAHIHRDDHYYRIQSERNAIYMEKETLEKVYRTLLEEHRVLQTSYDDVASEKEEALAQLRQGRREAESKRNEKADVMMRAEMDRLRTEL